jgi:hypothetical protein
MAAGGIAVSGWGNGGASVRADFRRPVGATIAAARDPGEEAVRESILSDSPEHERKRTSSFMRPFHKPAFQTFGFNALMGAGSLFSGIARVNASWQIQGVA